MTHTYYHAQSSARLFGGDPSDYQPLHDWLDASKESYCDFRHRAIRHHAEGVFAGERRFGITIVNSEGKQVPVRYILEQHIMEDCGRIPNLADWLSRIQSASWMARASKVGASRGRASQ